MNVIVSNLNGNKFVDLNVDVIKSITGEFTVDEIVQSFSNFFFNRMFLDITSIKDYSDINNFKKLSVGLDVSKVILLLSDDVTVNSDFYISSLVSMGIYNFARNTDELKYLYDNPNSYKDVAHLQKINEPASMVNINNIDTNVNTDINVHDIRVIGFKNFTSHAGSTSLIYMLKKHLIKDYSVAAIEVNKRDFIFYNDKDMISCRASEVENMIAKYRDTNVILIDLNDLDLSVAHRVCDEVIYLMESSILAINKVVMLDNNCFSKLSNNKVVLNCSLLSDKDIKRLEFESNIKFFAVLPFMDDRADNSEFIFPFLEKLGLYRNVN